MKRAPTIAVIGDSTVASGDPRDRFAEALGRSIIDHGWQLQTGGMGGVMEAASRGGRSSPVWVSGSIIGILPGRDRDQANPHIDVAIQKLLDDVSLSDRVELQLEIHDDLQEVLVLVHREL